MIYPEETTIWVPAYAGMTDFAGIPVQNHAGTDESSAQVDATCINIDADVRRCDSFVTMLSRDERERAGQFRHARDRARYIVRRGVLRQLLAKRLVCDPDEVPIATDMSGKPYVEESDLRFSLSHSNGMALYAFARGVEIGCDIEWLHSGVVSMDAADLFLSSCELESLKRCDTCELTERLLRYWTCKEAYLKARGTGLTAPAQRVIVSDGRPPRFLALPDADPSDWTLSELDLSAGYIGALVVHATSAIDGSFGYYLR